MAAVSNEVGPRAIKSTQELLGKVIKKPSLTEKLLKRPPFRFIHDIIHNIVKSSSFMKGLYREEELIADNITDKDAKISFLQKAVDVLGFVIGEPLSVRPSKIVAGLEADKTNEFLQILAKAVAQKKDTSAAVDKVLGGAKPAKNSSNGPEKKAASTKKPVNTVNKRGTSQERRTSSVVNKQPKKETRAPLSSNNQQTVAKTSTPASPVLSDSADHINDAPSSASSNKENPVDDDLSIANSNKNSMIHEENNAINGHNEDVVIGEDVKPTTHSSRPKSVKSARRKAEIPQLTVRPPTSKVEKDVPDQEVGSRPARPTTARAAPPKIISKREVEESNIISAHEEEERRRILSAKPVENLITEKTGTDNDDDDDIFVVEEAEKTNDDLTDSFNRTKVLNSQDLGSQKGSLVKQLEETKKELEGDQSNVKSDAKEEMVARLANRDIEKLRINIQTVSRLANPLGRILDYVQEDVDSMLSELTTWEEEYKKNLEKYEKEKHLINEDLIPLKNQLDQLDLDITHQLDRISTSKANILKNEEKIKKMVRIVVEKSI